MADPNITLVPVSRIPVRAAEPPVVPLGPLLRLRLLGAGDVSVGQALGRCVAAWAIAYDRAPGGLLRAVER